MQLFSFIPQNLMIDGRVELKAFPLNVMMVSYTVNVNGNTVIGSTLYEPKMTTYHSEDEEDTMDYPSKYDPRYYLRIYFNRLTGYYRCEKYYQFSKRSAACGTNWKNFFIHVGFMGLDPGEMCELEVVTNKKAASN